MISEPARTSNAWSRTEPQLPVVSQSLSGGLGRTCRDRNPCPLTTDHVHSYNPPMLLSRNQMRAALTEHVGAENDRLA